MHQGGLTTTVGAHQHNDFPRIDGEFEPLGYGDGLAALEVAGSQLSDVDEGGVRRRHHLIGRLRACAYHRGAPAARRERRGAR